MVSIKCLKYVVVAAFMAIATVSCQINNHEDSSFDSKLYIDSDDMVVTMLFKSVWASYEQELAVAIPHLATQQIDVTFAVDESLVSQYNSHYGASAVVLPAENYVIEDNSVIIYENTVNSTTMPISFKDLDQLSINTVYVLPVAISSASNIDVLESKSVMYYQFMGAASINVVADLGSNGNSLLIEEWANPDAVMDMDVATIEMLINLSEAPDYNTGFFCLYEAGSNSKETWFIRSEGGRLDVDGTTSNGTSTSTFRSKAGTGEPDPSTFVNKWTHIAVVYDSVNSKVKVYIDGVQYREDSQAMKDIDLGYTPFMLGTEYYPDRLNRYMRGKMSEVRIWNYERSAEEIANNPYEVDADSEGLQAYWKFDDGAGDQVTDHSIYGNHATATLSPLVWVSERLPAE